jgi:hypothetical protein
MPERAHTRRFASSTSGMRLLTDLQVFSSPSRRERLEEGLEPAV